MLSINKIERDQKCGKARTCHNLKLCTLNKSSLRKGHLTKELKVVETKPRGDLAKYLQAGGVANCEPVLFQDRKAMSIKSGCVEFARGRGM